MTSPPTTHAPGSGGRLHPWVGLAQALTGELLAAPGADLTDPASSQECTPAIIEWLAEAGWPQPRLAAHRQHCQQVGRPWPHPVDVASRGGWGAAQFHAQIAQLRAALGMAGLTSTRRDGPPRWDATDRRLLADRPPHHG